MPSVLDPAPAQLLNDYAHLPGGCSALPGQTSSRLCRFGATASPRTLLLFGDSHAQMWLPDVIQAAQRDGWAVVPVTKVSCQPADWESALGSPECRTWLRWALGAIRSLHPAAALVAGNYTWVAPPEDPDVSAGFDAVVRALHRMTATVTIIGDVPQRNVQPVDCLLRSHATATGCSESIPANGAALTDLVDQLAAGDGAGFIDTTGWFCASGQCPLVVGDLVTYRDLSHITRTYATALDSVFAAALRVAIPALGRAQG